MMKNPVKKVMDKITRPATHTDKKREAKKTSNYQERSSQQGMPLPKSDPQNHPSNQ